MGERCVVVGAGGISNAWFGPLKAEKVKVAGIVDLRTDLAKAQADKYQLDAMISSDLKDTLKKTRPDFVVDLTIPEAHCGVTCTALAAGAHVIGEKPMAASMAQARKMVRCSQETGKLYMVSQSRRWQPMETVMRRTLESGQVGDITTVNCDFYIGVHFGGFREEMPSPLILDMSIHHFDLVRYMSGLDPVAVYAKEFNPKGSWFKGDVSAICIFEMTGGVVFTYRGSWCGYGCDTSWNGDWRFIGTRGTMLYERDQLPRGQVADKDFHKPFKDVKVKPLALKHNGMHGALREMLTFLRTGQQPQTHCQDNIKSLAMVFAAIESSRKGRRVPIRAM